MSDALFEQAFDLVAATNTPLLVFHKDRAFALLDGDSYAKLLGRKKDIVHLTEEELLDTINREIALWAHNQKEKLDNEELDRASVYASVKSTD